MKFTADVAMYADLCPLPTAIAEIIAQAASGWLTLSDRYALRATLLQDTLNPEELYAINRLLYAIRRGWLKFER